MLFVGTMITTGLFGGLKAADAGCGCQGGTYAGPVPTVAQVPNAQARRSYSYEPSMTGGSSPMRAPRTQTPSYLLPKSDARRFSSP